MATAEQDWQDNVTMHLKKQNQARRAADPGIIAAMRAVPRELFVQEGDQADAYGDHPLPIGFGQTISQPSLVGLMTELLDPFAPSAAERRPVISGLCRGRKPEVGARFIYRTRIDPLVAAHLGLSGPSPLYFAVAAMRVRKVFASHEAASTEFAPRRYVISPEHTPYPPNLVHSFEPVAAVRRESSIVFRATVPGSLTIGYGKRKALAPPESTESDRQSTYADYRHRMRAWNLQAALCQIAVVNGREALALDPAKAPVLSAAEWKDWQDYGNGRSLPEDLAAKLRESIAAVGQIVL